MELKKDIPINLRLPEKLIKESDELAKEEGSTRSEIFGDALRSYISQRRKLQTAYSIVERRGRQAGIKTQEELDQILKEIKKREDGNPSSPITAQRGSSRDQL